MSIQKSLGDISNKVLATLILVGAFFLIVFALEDDSKNSVKISESGIPESQLSPEYVENARKHLMMTSDEVRFKNFKNQQEVLESAPSLSKTAEQRAYVAHEGLDLSSESNAKEIAKDLGRNNDQEVVLPETPDQLIQSQIFSQNQLDDYSRAYKEEYARQFVENARRGGYEVKLTDDFRVESVKKIRDPAGKSIFNTDNGHGPVR